MTQTTATKHRAWLKAVVGVELGSVWTDVFFFFFFAEKECWITCLLQSQHAMMRFPLLFLWMQNWGALNKEVGLLQHEGPGTYKTIIHDSSTTVWLETLRVIQNSRIFNPSSPSVRTNNIFSVFYMVLYTSFQSFNCLNRWWILHLEDLWKPGTY